jgi:hypothetical protein
MAGPSPAKAIEERRVLSLDQLTLASAMPIVMYAIVPSATVAMA